MTEDTYSKAFDRALFARILRYVWPYRLQVVLALLFLLVVEVIVYYYVDVVLILYIITYI